MSGWDELEQVPVEAEETQAINIDLLMARTFSTEEGQKVLAWMRDRYLERPCWQPGAEASLGMFREGENRVVRDIEARIKRAKSRTV